MIWIVSGLLCMLAGMVIMVLGSMWGLALLLGSGGLMVFNYVTMMRGRGDDPDQATVNGLRGQGKQVSEIVKDSVPDPGEQSPNIWEKMEK